MVEPNKLVSVYSFCNMQFDIYHSGTTVFTIYSVEVINPDNTELTIEPGRYRISYESDYDSHKKDYVRMFVSYYTNDNKFKVIANTVDGTNTGTHLQTVSHIVDFSDIKVTGSSGAYQITVALKMFYNSLPGTITFEAID